MHTTHAARHRKAAVVLAAGALALPLGIESGGRATAAPASAQGDVVTAAKPRFQMPFACDTHWRLDTYDSGHNPALDIVVKGNTGSSGKNVLTGYKGKVARTFWDRGAGNVIIINHGSGWYTAYYHLRDKHDKYVQKGDSVTAGTRIGHIGATGANSGGWAHLHYEQRYKSNGIPTEADRKPVHFNGKQYTGTGSTWTDVVSKNC
ncbi:M23 family metallopeptidase [Streptomyces coeruleorubidus]|uniref:M23 family metallopeptidase n=1 Tax=Streptomyces coeruleorubidus TaxID=116188 RepID=A0ABZ0KAF6_STRC4|nr:M23 family metallopeptidase [Streptomyces coeruleorubidus]WOT34775.1 M23 family metallopeptidase [Streptomyces coeruleorubidus]